MTPEQISLVQKSFARMVPDAATAADLFYGRLFELDPAISKLFSTTDLTAQGQRLMTMISAAVRGLDDVTALVPVLQDLGRRHITYGVRPDHYASVGEALLDTLEKGLGDEFTPPVRAAWAAVYQTIADTMIDAATAAERSMKADRSVA